MENYIKTTTKLYVAVNENGEIVNGNDFKIRTALCKNRIQTLGKIFFTVIYTYKYAVFRQCAHLFFVRRNSLNINPSIGSVVSISAQPFTKNLDGTS